MDNSSEGSSAAARGALAGQSNDQHPDRPPRLLGRLMGTIFSDSRHGAAAENGGLSEHPEAAGSGYRVPASVLELPVAEVAVTKADIVAVPLEIGLHELVEVFRESGRSRLPVFSGSLDNPCGLILLKDLALKHGFSAAEHPFVAQDMLRGLLYVPPSMPTRVLLQKMQAERKHMALVIDEYGGVDGLVTIEDLFEQVFGDIEDEHDIVDEDGHWTEEAPGVYLCRATTPLKEFERLIGKDLVDKEDEEEIDTLGGLVFVLTGRVPARGEVVAHPEGLEIEIVDADPRRVKHLRIRNDTH